MTSPETPVRILQVGAGGMGRAWLRTLARSPEVELVGLVDLDLEVARSAAADGGFVDLPVATALAELLKSEGYIADFKTAERADKPGKILSIDIKYSPDRERTITGIKRVSKPGLRVYKKSDEIPRVLGGLGVAVLSTSQGLMTDREARRRNVGGEVLCYVW